MATDTETGDGSGCDNETALVVRIKDIKGIKVRACMHKCPCWAECCAIPRSKRWPLRVPEVCLWMTMRMRMKKSTLTLRRPLPCDWGWNPMVLRVMPCLLNNTRI